MADASEEHEAEPTTESDDTDPSATDSASESRPAASDSSRSSDETADGPTDESAEESEESAPSLEELRAQVEEKYDFENFGPEQMAEMTAEEWEAVFDPETWITGSELLDRLEADIKDRVLRRDVFARIERLDNPDRLVAYSDEGYVVVYPDGTTEGQGTVLRDVEPLVALNSMEEYDPPAMPEGDLLPEPVDVPEGSGEKGNLLIQIIAGAQMLAAIALLGTWLLGVFRVDPFAADPIILVAGLGFLVIGFVLFLMVANARLSDRFRAEEYRNRLRAIGIDAEERPEWLPPEVEWPGGELEETAGANEHSEESV